MFPWPPPAPSATVVLPDQLFGNRYFETLHDLDAVLRTGLQQTGYIDTSYLWVPHGFALATRLERITRDGAPGSPDRFSLSTKLTITKFSLGDYLRALFTANPGHYRVIVFIVTDVPFTQTPDPVTPGEAEDWLRGPKWLPNQVGKIFWTPHVRCTALVYEFIHEQEQPPRMLRPDEGALDAQTHLKGAGLWNPQVFTAVPWSP